MSEVLLHLRKGEESKDLRLILMPLGAMNVAKEISNLLKSGWELDDVEGDNERIVSYLKEQIRSYKANPKEYKVPIRETVKLATSIVKPKGKIHLNRKQLLLSKLRKQKDEQPK